MRASQPQSIAIAGTPSQASPHPVLFAVVCLVLMLLGIARAQGQMLPAPPAPAFMTMVGVPAGTFTMGRRTTGDDALYGRPNELPRHPVTLSAYRLGKFEVTNGQFCDVLNWARGRGYLQNANGTAYTGGNVCRGGRRLLVLEPGTNPDFAYYELSMIQFSNGAFTWKTRAAAGGKNYSMENHPVVGESWYGAIAFCNWLSEREGLTPCYDLSTWEPIDADPATPGLQFADGYRLPTRAEWIRAASVDGTYQWIYGFRSDTLTSATGTGRVNWRVVQNDPIFIAANPLNLLEEPFTTPVGWFNGINVSPNGNVRTIDSPSPVGAYDMCGNAVEWVYDWATESPMTSLPETNPTGPTTGTLKEMHGGRFNVPAQYARVYNTDADPPGDTYFHDSFRVARNGGFNAAENWPAYR